MRGVRVAPHQCQLSVFLFLFPARFNLLLRLALTPTRHHTGMSNRPCTRSQGTDRARGHRHRRKRHRRVGVADTRACKASRWRRRAGWQTRQQAGSRPVRAETLAYQHRQAAQEECRTPALQRQRLAHQPPRQPRPSLLAPRAPAQRRVCSTHCAAHWRLVHHHQHQRHPHPALPSAYLRSHPPLGLG